MSEARKAAGIGIENGGEPMEAKDTQIFFFINCGGRWFDLTHEFLRQAEVSFKAAQQSSQDKIALLELAITGLKSQLDQAREPI